MNKARYRRIGLITAIVFIMIAVAVRLVLSPVGIGIALQTQGLHLASGTLHVGLHRTRAEHLVVTSSRGEPVFAAGVLDVEYDLGSLLAGQPHALGLVALRLEHPVVTISRRSDGSWNVPSGRASEPSPTGGPVLPVHLKFQATVEDGVVEIDQPNLLDHAARSLVIDHVTLGAIVDSDGQTSYRVHAEIGKKPLIAQGAIDSTRGLAMHQAQVADMPIATLINAVVDSDAFVVHSGEVSHLTLTAYGAGRRGQAVLGDHITVQSDLSRFDAHITGIEQPLEDVRGRVVVTDDTVTFDHTQGRIAAMPFTASGAVFAFGNPQLRITADGTGDLDTLRRLFSFSKALPVHGSLTTHLTVEGPANSPVVIVDVRDGHLHYDAMPLLLERGTIIYDDSAVDLASVNFHYGDIAFSAAGSIGVGDHVRPKIAIDAAAPSASLPYLDGLFGGTTDVFVLLGGEDSALDGRAVIDGRDGERTLRGLAHLDGHGEGAIGPIALEEHGHTSILAGGALVRPKGVYVGVIGADNVRMSPSRATLPGLDLPALVPVAGALSGTVAIAGDYHSYFLNGRVQAHDLLYDGRYAADTLDVAFGGDLRLLDLEHADLRGPFGNVRVTGLAGSSGAALQGDVQADLGVLGRVFGRGDFSGSLDLPVWAQSDGRRLAIGIDSARFAGARAFGIPLQSLAGSAVLEGTMLTVAARAEAAGGELLAGGELSQGIGISGMGLQDPGLMQGAVVDAAALLQGSGPHMHASGMAMLRNALIDGLPIAATTSFDANATRITLTGSLVQTHGLVAEAAGGISDFTHGGVVDMNGRVVNASASLLAQAVAPQTASLYPGGSIDATLHIRGALSSPHIAGNIVMPEGTISGLAFQNAQTQIDASPKLVRLRHGSVTVGTTHVRLGGAYDGQNFRSYLNAPQANLADFNDFFDQNNMLAGFGQVRVTAAAGTNAVRTLADVDLQNVRVSSFALGTTQAHWRSQGREINGSLGIDGLAGKLSVIGGLQLAEQHPMVHLLSRSRLNLNGSASDLDLERWLPALGVNAPVTGRLDIAGRAVGSLPKLTADVSIDAHGATIGPVPIDEARAHLVARNGRGILDSAHVVVHGAVADASGNFGFAPSDPVALALHAQAPDIGDLAASIVRALRSERAGRLGMSDVATQADHLLAALSPLDGAASTSFQIQGSMAKPHFGGALDVEGAHLRGLPLPRVLASFELQGKKLNLNDAEIAFQKGNITVAGSLPLVLSPFSIGPADAPLSLDISANAVDLSSFTSLLPPKSTLHGMLDGAIALEGTPASPQLFGELDLGAGSFVSPLESVPVRAANGTLRLGGRSANLLAAATVGGGVFSLNGHASVENLTAIGYHSDYTLHASATHATVDIANVGRGTVDADVTVAHASDGVPHVDGSIALSDAQMPFSAFYNPSSSNTAVANSLFAETELNLKLIAGKNARVRSGSIDLSASGEATLGGTIAQPTLAGAFTSNGGTLTYFNRSFHVASGRVAFDPAVGVDPQITAAATTIVDDPDTNTAHNVSGRVTITLNVTGSLDHINVVLSSDPSYDRQQILGLLLDAPLLGAVHFNQSTGSGASANNGLNLPAASTNSGQVSVSQEAFSFVNAQFTQSLLAPISSALGGAVGLSDLDVNFDQTGGLDLSARRHIFGNVYAFFRDSIGMPTRQSLGVDFEPNDATAVSVSVFQEQGLSTLGRTNTTTLFTPQQNLQETASSASGGATTSGVSFSLNRRFP